MKTNHFLHVCGSVIKRESLIPITSNILENTTVVEANQPYANYYGRTPEKNALPYSFFLFTKHNYSLEEILRFTQKINSCYVKNINIASAMVNFSGSQLPAIRIKSFPDYEHLMQLQECYQKEGVEFMRKFKPEETALVQIQKCFVLEEIDNRIFIDQTEKDKAYIALPSLIDHNEFQMLVSKVLNNGDCTIFDAALASIIIDSELCDLIRIYAERLNIDQIRCIKTSVNTVLKNSGEISAFKTIN